MKPKLKDLGERQILRHIRAWLGNKFIGDDAAVLPKKRLKGNLLATTDALVEGIHFRTKNLNWSSLGFKAIAVNASDLAAMGGRPLYALISLGLKPTLELKQLKSLYQGFQAAGRIFHLEIVGGNLSSSPVNFIDVFLLGEHAGGQILKRSGAEPGDRLFLTGCLGKASAKNFQITIKDFKKIRLAEGIFLAKNKLARAAIDLSDGLAAGLIDLGAESKVGAMIETGKIPLAKNITLKKALRSGDDFELLLAVPPKLTKILSKKFGQNFSTPLTEIGRITKKRKIKFFRKNKEVFGKAFQGYNHFR